MLRSEQMGCYQVIVSRELAWEMINMLGELGDDMVEFIDCNKMSISQRTFSSQIKRCDEIQVNLSKIKQLLIEYGFNLSHCDDVEDFLIKLRSFLSTRDRIEKTYIDDINYEIESFSQQIFSNSAKIEELEKKYKDLKEQSATYFYYKDKFINSLYNQHREEVETRKQQKSIISQKQDEEEEGRVVLSKVAVSKKGQKIERHRNEEDADWEDQFLTKSYTTVIGTIATEDVYRFIRSIYRLTKGNSWNTRKAHDEYPDRTIFILLFPIANLQNSFLIGKINKILDVFNTKIYPSIIHREQIDKKLLQIEQDKTDVMRVINLNLNQKKFNLLCFINSKVINLAKKSLYEELEEWSLPRNGLNCSKIIEMQLFVEKEKSIFIQLNNLKTRKHVFIGKLWCPRVYQEQLMQTKDKLSILYPNQGQAQIIECKVDEDDIPPTLFKLNAFTAPFQPYFILIQAKILQTIIHYLLYQYISQPQQIVNTYGVPRYKEINPGIYCITMFSLQFGIMFGDIGHGGFLFLFGLYLCFFHQTNPFDTKRDLNIIYSLRYVILLLGFFALYSGLIYNDFFSLPIYLFHKSCYINEINEEGEMIFVKKPNCTYPFGMDPKWYIASNELNFFNSYKMKLAVIIGVLQMTYGIILRGYNNKYFGKWVDFFFEFIPQLVFMVSTFGYMIFMIIMKWSINYTKDTSQAPSIINLMINLPLKLGEIPDGKSLWDIDEQEEVQQYILLIAGIMVPLMLFPKPFILYLQNKKKSQQNQAKIKDIQMPLLQNEPPPQLRKHMESDDLIQELRRTVYENDLTLQKTFNPQESVEIQEDQLEEAHQKKEHKFDFSEVFVHQLIETIEFVLGSISSTASYLRLWALSLAHSQLSRVFFEKTIGSGLKEGSAIQIIIGWFIFFHITIFILMSMDLMECFLHSIRLQWVEFQGRFYKADGVWFNSFSFIGNLRQYNVDLSSGLK